jgi:nicotinamidase-related amidase
MNRALLVIDVQESFRRHRLWPLMSEPKLPDRIDPLLDMARAAGDQVIWVLHSEPGTGTVFDSASGHVRLMDGLVPRDGEPVLTKTSHNAFTTTNLQQLLTATGVRELMVCGIRTEQCCETTTRIGSDLGYRVTFAIDATATTPIPHRDLPADASLDEINADPRTLTVEEIISRTGYVLDGRFADVRTVAELTGT